MRSALPILVAMLGVAEAGAPKAVRDGAMGCWQMRRGARTTFRMSGGRVMARSTFADRPKGGPREWDEEAAWRATSGELELSCRPRSQHGEVCLVRPTADGLRVRVFTLGYNPRLAPRLVEDFVAERCPR